MQFPKSKFGQDMRGNTPGCTKKSMSYMITGGKDLYFILHSKSTSLYNIGAPLTPGMGSFRTDSRDRVPPTATFSLQLLRASLESCHLKRSWTCLIWKDPSTTWDDFPPTRTSSALLIHTSLMAGMWTAQCDVMEAQSAEEVLIH